MAFDEQLERAFDTISGLIRAEVSRQVHAASDELAAAVRGRSAPDGTETMTARLAEGVRALGAARSLSEVLDTLTTCAGLEASRAGVLLVRGNRFHRWRFIGFDPSFDGVDALDVARADAGVIARAADTATVVTGGREGHPAAPAFAQLPAGRRCAAFPLAFARQTVAVLYADAGTAKPGLNLEPGTLNLEPLEVLALFAARSLEALTAIKAARSLVPGVGSPKSR